MTILEIVAVAVEEIKVGDKVALFDKSGLHSFSVVTQITMQGATRVLVAKGDGYAKFSKGEIVRKQVEIDTAGMSLSEILKRKLGK